MIPSPGGDLPDLARTRAETLARSVLPCGCAIWAGAEVMHLTGAVPVTDVIMGAVTLTAVSWGAALKNGSVPSLPWWAALAGGWVAAADVLGPLAWWPAPLLTAAWLVYTLAAYRFAFRHEAVVSAREWRDARIGWLDKRQEWHLGGSHLLDYQETRLGELYTVGTRGTSRRASQLATPALAEIIAEAEGLATNRVRVWAAGLAGRLMISIRRVDPWADPLLHPLACDDHEITLPERRSITDPAVVGQDPETGTPLLVPLYAREFGANRVSATASTGGGKGVLEDALFEHVTACDDAVAVHLNLSIKGHEDEECWGPACWLTAYGPNQKARAAAVLKVIASVLEWRVKNFRRGEYVPSPEHPAIIIFNDESDAALSALQEDLRVIATKGRSHGAGIVRLGQRNTREYTDPRTRPQDNVRCTGLVQNANEARHAGSGNGPDMSTYGEGKPGVWKVELLGGTMSLGRTWIFHRTPARHAAECARIAAERAHYQPEITGACREYLGSAYETLRATEVYERWARAQDPDGWDNGEPDAPDAPAAETHAPAAPAPAQEPAAAASAAQIAVADRDPLDLEELFQMDDPAAAKLERINEKNAATRRLLEQHAVPPAGLVSPESVADRTAERWRQVDAQTEVPAEVRPRLLAMLEGDGTTSALVAAEFGVKRWKALLWLRALRGEGIAQTTGEKKGTRWVRATPPGDGDTP